MPPEEEIHLTLRELEEIKDDVAFKAKTTSTLKHVLRKLDYINGIRHDVNGLKVHRNVHWFLISVIIASLLGLAFTLIKG